MDTDQPPADAPSSDPRGQGDEYVNYLPVPRRVRRFVRVAAPCLLALVGAVAYVVASSQGSAGSGVWNDTETRTITGVVVAAPYPMLWTRDAADTAPRMVLLVEQGKHGAARAAAMNAQTVTVTGTVLTRNARVMLELLPGAPGLSPAPGQPSSEGPPPREDRGQITVRGEIVDAKCYLGAMKPGTGKTHKECATLCVRGGIPAALVVRGPDGVTEYLIESADGGPIDPALIRLIAEPVEVTGRWSVLGGINVLTVQPQGVRRL